MPMSQTRNGPAISPTFGPKKGGCFAACGLDLFSRMGVGWSMAARQDGALVINAFQMALARRSPQEGLTSSF